ncbi:MAG: hypothetical protein WA476_15960 [Acidobacteriaceae bacterium]
MAIFERFSRRQKKLKGGACDVYKYDSVPATLRVQICHIWRKCLGQANIDYVGNNPAYREIHIMSAEEFGLFNFPSVLHGDAGAIVDFFTNRATPEQALDMIEIAFRIALRWHGDYPWKDLFRPSISSGEAIEDLNARLREHDWAMHL